MGSMRGEEYQELVDEISAALAAPATLQDRDFALVAFGAHDGEDRLLLHMALKSARLEA